jgi:predicted nuclease with TOPRIM domain
MSNENKPDWNDLQNEQAETNAWQIDRIWMTAKKLPVYFWVLTILLTATMLNTLRLHYVMQDIKTEVSAGLNAEITELKAAKKAMRSRVLESQKSVNTLVDRLATVEAERDEYHRDAHVLFDKRERERKLLQESQAQVKTLQRQIYLKGKVAMNYKNSRPSEMRTIYEVLRNRGWNIGNIDSQDLVNQN